MFFTAVTLTGLIGVTFLGTAGNSGENLFVVLRLTALSAFIVLLVVFVARPLQQMFRTPMTISLLRNRRLLGIAFAGIHTVHLGLIIYRARVIESFEFSIAANLSSWRDLQNGGDTFRQVADVRRRDAGDVDAT